MIAIFLSVLSFSFFLPGNIKYLDKLRLKIQIPIINGLSNYQISNVHQSAGISAKESNSISYSELSVFFREFTPSCIIFTSSRGYLIDELIAGDWKHAAIYLGTKSQIEKYFSRDSTIMHFLSAYYQTGNEILIIDSSIKGVAIREFNELSNLNTSSKLKSLICFSINNKKSDIRTFLINTFKQVGKSFDYDFISNNSSYYCSELVYKSLCSIGVNVSNKTKSFGRQYVSPTNIVEYITDKGISNNEFTLQLFLNKNNSGIKNICLNNINYKLHTSHTSNLRIYNFKNGSFITNITSSNTQ